MVAEVISAKNVPSAVSPRSLKSEVVTICQSQLPSVTMQWSLPVRQIELFQCQCRFPVSTETNFEFVVYSTRFIRNNENLEYEC
jgi:hypothetical protein